MIGEHALGHLLQQDRLAGPRRADDQPALAEADRHDQVDHAHGDFVGRRLQHDALVGMQRRQVVEEDLLGQLVRILVVDRLDAQQREVTLVLLGRANLARHRGAGPQAEAANLAGRDVNVVGAGQVVIVGAAEEAEAVGQDLQRPLAEHQAVELHALLEDLEDQVLLLDARDFGEVFLAGLLDQLRHGHPLQLGDVDVALLDLLVAVVRFVAHVGGFVGQFLGQAQRLAIEQFAFGPRGKSAAGTCGLTALRVLVLLISAMVMCS